MWLFLFNNSYYDYDYYYDDRNGDIAIDDDYCDDGE